MNALGAGWHDRGIAARFADGAMCMSRKQMIEFHANVDHEQVDSCSPHSSTRRGF
jgi:hypothetical protein